MEPLAKFEFARAGVNPAPTDFFVGAGLSPPFRIYYLASSPVGYFCKRLYGLNIPLHRPVK